MKISGTAQLSSDRESVWRALNDPEVLVRCIPGCQRLEAVGADAFKMTLNAGVGSIRGVYDGQVSLHDQQEPGSFRMQARGTGAPGTIGADVLVRLEPGDDGGTSLSYEADATVGGMIGGVGQRMLTGVSKRMAADFFGNVDTALAGTPEPASTAASPSDRAPGSPAAPVFTAPQSVPTGGSSFALGVAVGAAAGLAGAVVGAWIAGRRSG
ncbi:MAG: carbon monoxide dehydrogenase G protein [uncultured Nocardioidaceae bacterium]|uniref:Carbon monoxide dehydrogenase G protein n=1 Tax=uncultured Nocardioidaceae bacterium TaxID=253824 RepID=A0A6J4MRU3_9ACTN|nr:MAG: carbon monoxide dehydrogenase G protein [uncultured Nocardioidaceae bacterium]